MRGNSYFRRNSSKEKEENNIQKQKNIPLIPKKYSEDFIEEEIKDNPYNESESSREDDLPIKEGLFNETTSVIKGILLAFVFFSVIIYSLLYMLAPEKSANLIFLGNYDSSLYNNTFCSEMKNNFYKLDEIKIREKIIVMNLSLYCLNEGNDTNNYLKINVVIDEQRINKVIVENKNISKDIYIEMNNLEDVVYNDYKINDFPFWLCLYNKENFDMRNITSEYLINYF